MDLTSKEVKDLLKRLKQMEISMTPLDNILVSTEPSTDPAFLIKRMIAEHGKKTLYYSSSQFIENTGHFYFVKETIHNPDCVLFHPNDREAVLNSLKDFFELKHISEESQQSRAARFLRYMRPMNFDFGYLGKEEDHAHSS